MYSQNEKWKQVPGYNYEVSDLGNVRNKKNAKLLRPFDRGYLTVQLCDGKGKWKNYYIHCIVMLAFVGERPNREVINHINGNKHDNRLGNLEYCTQSYNRREDFRLGRQCLKGEKNTQAKLKESDVLEIVKLYNDGGQTYRGLASKYGVAFTSISNIFNGHCWSYLTGY